MCKGIIAVEQPDAQGRRVIIGVGIAVGFMIAVMSFQAYGHGQRERANQQNFEVQTKRQRETTGPKGK